MEPAEDLADAARHPADEPAHAADGAAERRATGQSGDVVEQRRQAHPLGEGVDDESPRDEQVGEGDTVEAGQAIATIEAMKMEAAITAPVAGTVQRLAIGPVQQVEGGDLVLVITPAS